MRVDQGHPVVLSSPRTEVRRLDPRDRAELEALLDGEPGYSLFLRSNLDALGVDERVEYWAAYVDGSPRAALMVVVDRAAVYAPPGGLVAPLAEVVHGRRLRFVMGRADQVEAMLAAAPSLVPTQWQRHVLVRLDPADLTPPRAASSRFGLGHGATSPRAPLGARVRRADPGDLGGLVRLYTGAAGFEHATPAQVRATLRERVVSLRTYVALVGRAARTRGRIVAAASTSGEAPRAAMIGGVWTDPAWRDRGCGTAVVAALAGELVGEGRVPYLFYLVDNAPAARVYAKIGFRPVGPWTVVYFDG